jgi:hypothetical protein
MEEALRDLLIADTGVNTLVSGRVTWGSRPQGKPMPAIVMYLVDDISGHSQSGPDNLSVARVQVNCHGANYPQAMTLSKAVREALDGYRGGVFQGIFHALTRDSREGGSNEADRPFLRQMDFIVNWSKNP